MDKLLIWLQGKKGSLASIIGLIVGYLATRGILGQYEVILIMGLSLILFGEASIKTKELFNK